jgi:hypothetical protein
LNRARIEIVPPRRVVDAYRKTHDLLGWGFFFIEQLDDA